MPDLLLHVTEYEPFSKLFFRDDIISIEGRETHLDISMYNNGNESPTLLLQLLRRGDIEKPVTMTTSSKTPHYRFMMHGTCATMGIPESWSEAWLTILHDYRIYTYLAITRENPDIAHAADLGKAMLADGCGEVWQVPSRHHHVSVYKGLVAV